MDQEALCRAIDALENVTASVVNLTTLPDRIHVEAMRAILPDIVETLKKHSDYYGFVGVLVDDEAI